LYDERSPADKDPGLLRGLGKKWPPLKPADPDLLRYWKNVERYWIDEGAYAHLQMTRPQTLFYAQIRPSWGAVQASNWPPQLG
jgi:hypothetical protein